jgi:hypothetical protein
MRKIREFLRLQCGLSQRETAQSCKIGLGTVYEYVRRARDAGLAWPLPEQLTDEALERLLFPPPPRIASNQRPLPDWETVGKELRRKGVTLLLLWYEYRAAHPDGYGYSRFCELYNRWAGAAEPRMRCVHKAGEKLFVDYAGPTVPLIDPKTGPTGVVKTYLACALAHKACREGCSVHYTRTTRLLGELSVARADGTYARRLAALARTDLLVLDDWGIASLTGEQRRDLLEILDDRYDRRATLVAAQLPAEHWHEYIADPTIADAILGRLIHNAHKITLSGESMRKLRPAGAARAKELN